ncbi:MAG: sn-glycerol-3-phosphate ABC transporter ATP-binding protein UgpC [Oscillospiraceae bacterium]|nr:sn-glycerol-3-phosphate ABC transporter ATP-binding protein UgpC [Oscillospiraceae bacterium]
MAGVTLTGVEKVYDGGVKAVSDFNLDIADKSFVVFVGPSGCGKSTTLRMIAGLEQLTGGEICIDGRVVNDVPAKDRDIAMVFQNYALYPHMTVFQNMAFGLTIRKFPKSEIRRRVDEAAAMLEITHLLDRLPRALSGGERQRTALGRALVRDPKVFLLDEPLSNLDARLRATMRAELKELHRRVGTTFIYVTHDQTEAMTMGDQIVVMKDGFIQQAASPQDLFHRPANVFAATFIGAPPMNLIPGVLRAAGEGVSAVFGRFSLPLPERFAVHRQVRDYLEKSVIFGLRPTDIDDAAEASNPKREWVIRLPVEQTELLGAEMNVICKEGDLRVTAVVGNQSKAKEGQPLDLCLDLEKLHIFDAETERSILLV